MSTAVAARLTPRPVLTEGLDETAPGFIVIVLLRFYCLLGSTVSSGRSKLGPEAESFVCENVNCICGFVNMGAMVKWSAI